MDEKWEHQKMLDLYIHEYLVKKNMRTTAYVFAREADLKFLPLAPTDDGHLSEWWRVFWDVYNAGSQNNPPGQEASTSNVIPFFQATQSIESAAQNAHLALTPEIRYLLRNMDPRMQLLGIPDLLLQTVSQTAVSGQEMGSFMQNDIPPMMPTMDFSPNMFGQNLELNSVLAMGDLPTGIEIVPSPMSFGSTQNVRSIEQSSSSSNNRRKRLNYIARHRSAIRASSIGTSSSRRTSSELKDTGGSELNRSLSEGHSLAGASESLANSESSSKRPVTLILLDDDPEEKSMQIENNSMAIPLTHTLPENSAAQKQKEEDFPFALVRGHRSPVAMLLCCDFSAKGRFLAAAGHEKKVVLWNMIQSKQKTIQGHTENITDVRFKPDSNIFATASFDRSVKIWNAANDKESLCNLVVNAHPVMSVDFHPQRPDLLCFCDSIDEIRLWNFKESLCCRALKGAHGQLRFQPRQGNLLAAANGKVINLFDMETGMIRQRFEGHEKDVRSMSWDVCGEYLVSASNDGARIWSLASGARPVHVLHAGGATKFSSCIFHPAYTQVVAVGSHQSVCIWNPAMANRTWNFHAHKGIVSGIAGSPETNMIATVGYDQWVKIWK